MRLGLGFQPLPRQDLRCRGVDSAHHRVGARVVIAGGCGCGCSCGDRIVVAVVGSTGGGGGGGGGAAPGTGGGGGGAAPGTGSGGGAGRVEPLGDVEVGEADVPGIVEEHVVRLEVAMQHAVLVQVRHLAQGEGDGGVLGGEW